MLKIILNIESHCLIANILFPNKLLSNFFILQRGCRGIMQGAFGNNEVRKRNFM